MRRRSTVIMCADIVGYTALMGEDEALAVNSVRSLKREHLEPVAAAHGGEVLKRMGDGWIIAFPKVEAALDCATEVQSDLAEHEVIKLRIGCHQGDIVEDEDDFYGAGVNIAQRIETEAPPGGVMLSEDLYQQLSDRRQDGLADAGMFNLKNISTPMRLYQWRPANLSTAPNAGELPSIGIEAVSFAPQSPDNEAIAFDLHEGIVQQQIKRTGIKAVDVTQDPDTSTVFLLRGRLRVAGTRARFMLTLLFREDMSTLWSTTYEGDASDVFEFTDQMLDRAEADIRLQTIAHAGDRLAHLNLDQLSVSELKSRAASLNFEQTPESWEACMQALDRAVALSPQDGMALAMRAHNLIGQWKRNFAPDDAKLTAQLAQDLDVAIAELPESDFVYWPLGKFKLAMRDDIPAAKFAFQRSQSINKKFAGVFELKAEIAMREGRYADALESMGVFGNIVSAGAFKPRLQAVVATLKYCTGDYAGALQETTELCFLRPEDRSVHLLHALVCREAGNKEGLAAAREACGRLKKEPSMLIYKEPYSEDFAWMNDALHFNAEPV